MLTQLKDIKVPGFERVVSVTHDNAGLFGFIAVHNTKLGPALGGIRYKEYSMGNDAIQDVCDLARAMTNKNALANINYGGGKAVIMKHGGPQDRVEIYKAMGEAVEQLGGTYICCEDVGTVTADLYNVLETTKHCAGTKSDSGIATAAGLFHVFRTYCEWIEAEYTDVTVTISGLGKVGFRLAERLCAAGFPLKVTDLIDYTVETFCRDHTKTDRAYTNTAHQEACEIYSPCALGGTINRYTRRELNCNAIIGSANNQLDMNETARYLHRKGILYFPDYLVNAGGVVALAAELDGQMENLDYYLEMIGDRAGIILRDAQYDERPLLDIANEMVWETLE